MQINSDKGLFSAAFIYDGMLLHRDQGKGFIRPADTSLIAAESSPLMKCCQRRFSSQMTSTLKNATHLEIGRSLNDTRQRRIEGTHHKKENTSVLLIHV